MAVSLNTEPLAQLNKETVQRKSCEKILTKDHRYA